MKSVNLYFVTVLLSLVAFRFIATTLDEVGTTIDEVKQQTIYRLAQDHFSPYYTTAIKDACRKLVPGVREAALFYVGKVIRDYVESPQFKLDYEKYLRETYTGSSFDAKDPRWEASRAQKFDELTKFVATTAPSMVEMFVKTLDADIQGKQSMIKMLSDPNMKALAAKMPSTSDMSKDIEDDESLQKLYKSDPAEFKKKYPEIMAARQMRDEMTQAKSSAENNTEKAEEDIAKRIDYHARLRQQLQEFLNATANVDFNAVTKVDANGVKKFVNPAYEEKESDWKFYYRCGKEAIAGARKYAQTWLGNLH